MISTDLASKPTARPTIKLDSEERNTRKLRENDVDHSVLQKMLHLHRMTWVCLFLACLGVSWFSFQYIFVPQPKSFMPDWHGAQWIQSASGNAPVAYFRYGTRFNGTPDEAAVTIAANQVFRLYVNGTYVSSNAADFAKGHFPHAYMYDITSSLTAGTNVIALQVANDDQQSAAVRMSLAIVQGGTTSYVGSSPSWQATSHSILVYPRSTPSAIGGGSISAPDANSAQVSVMATPSVTVTSDPAVATRPWSFTSFDATTWQQAQVAADPLGTPLLEENPAVYARPMPSTWMSAGASQETYVVRQVSVPFNTTGTWLRLAATGTADIFINGHFTMAWNGQAPVPRQSVATYFSDDENVAEYRTGLIVGTYDISSYLHPGVNTIAVHVTAPGISSAQVGLGGLRAALSVDLMVQDVQHATWLAASGDWHASGQPVDGWAQGSNAALNWPSAVSANRPGAARLLYLADGITSRDTRVVSPLEVGGVLMLSIGGVLGLWLCMALLLRRRFSYPRRKVLEMASLAFLPALACEVLLVTLAREPQISQPFPYTGFWALVLLLLVGVGFLLLWRPARLMQRGEHVPSQSSSFVAPGSRDTIMEYRNTAPIPIGQYHFLRIQLLAWLRVHWPLILIMLLALPLIAYNLAYEPFWQDELSSYYAAKGIVAKGLPVFASGFLYTKGELYSYLLALWMFVFGAQPEVVRVISMLEFLISLPLLYMVGCYFFHRRVALLATAMLAFSPVALLWGRQTRMYEQAHLLTLLVIFLFYKAVRERQNVCLVYLAAGILVLDYLSHEEIFITLPALVICVLLASKDKEHRLPWVLRQKHWWYATAIAGSIIAVQLLATKLTHPPLLGTDQSQQPLIQFTTENIPYYVKVLFFSDALGAGKVTWMIINSLLATIGCIWAFRSRNRPAQYCALFLIVSLLTLVFLFTLTSDRYLYTVLPVYYLLGAYALFSMVQALWSFACPHLVAYQHQLFVDPKGSLIIPLSASTVDPSIRGGHLSRPMCIVLGGIIGLVCASVLIAPVLPLSNYNLFVSRVTGMPYHQRYPDYNVVGQYVQQHMQKGDIVIAAAPSVSVYRYAGRLDYFFAIDWSLYLFEKNGHIAETLTAGRPLFNQDDFQAVLAAHPRVWIVSGRERYLPRALSRFTFPSDFHIVAEGYGTVVYLRGG